MAGRMARSTGSISGPRERKAAYHGAAHDAADISHAALQPYLPLKVEGYTEKHLRSSSVELVYAFRSSGEGVCPFAVPDGCVDLAFGIGPSDVLVTMGGTVLSAKGWDFAGAREWVGCRFHPGEAILPEGVSPQDLIDRDIVLDEGILDGRMAEELFQAPSQLARMEILTDAVIEGTISLPQGSRPGSRSERELERFTRRRILASGGCTPISSIADEAGVSAHYLRRSFMDIHGFTPKQFSRFVRFQRAMELIAHVQDASQAHALAAACGYADQSHLVHEFNEFAGKTPGKFRQLVRVAG